MLDTLKETINIISNSLRAIDYNPFFEGKSARFVKEMMYNIVNTQLIDLGTLQSDCIYLAIAVNTDKIIDHEITVINENLETIDKACNGRYNWNIIRLITTIEYRNTSLEGFWSKVNKDS